MSTNTKLKMKPSYYSPLPFHGVRTILALSAMIVSAILIFFCIELQKDKYKIPWTFLIVAATALVTLLWLLLTSFVVCCGRLSPLLNLFVNIPLVILWNVGLGMIGWGIFGTLSHSCTKVNWGNDDGAMICQHYKALFSFMVFATLSQIAMVVLDVRARIAQNRSGKYIKMDDVKLEPFDSTHNLVPNNTTHTNNATYRDEPGWKPGQRSNDYGDIAGHDGQAQFRMGQFGGQNASYYTGYDRRYGNN